MTTDSATPKNNLEAWNAMRTPPKEVLKTIKAGRLRNFTDIKPQWRYKVMTEQYGPCGIGWKYTIDNQRVVDGIDKYKFAFADISLFIKDGEKWSDAIPGTGGSMLIAKESNGPYMNDEAFKMAVTDALSVAMSRIGVAADIYMGGNTRSKYSAPGSNTNTYIQQPQQPPPPKAPAFTKYTAAQAKAMLKKMADIGYTAGQAKAIKAYVAGQMKLDPTDIRVMFELEDDAKFAEWMTKHEGRTKQKTT